MSRHVHAPRPQESIGEFGTCHTCKASIRWSRTRQIWETESERGARMDREDDRLIGEDRPERTDV